jgi:hypothetical protein
MDRRDARDVEVLGVVEKQHRGPGCCDARESFSRRSDLERGSGTFARVDQPGQGAEGNVGRCGVGSDVSDGSAVTTQELSDMAEQFGLADAHRTGDENRLAICDTFEDAIALDRSTARLAHRRIVGVMRVRNEEGRQVR